MQIVSVLGDGHFENLAFDAGKCVAETGGLNGLQSLIEHFLDERHHVEALQLYEVVRSQAREMVTVSWHASESGVSGLRIYTDWYDRHYGCPFVFHESEGLPDPVS